MPECSALKNHICISVDGNFSPCCRYGNHDQKFSINDYTFDEFRNTEFYKNIISNMENGWDDGCLKCKAEEDRADKPSMRQRLNKDFSGDNIEFVEISISNQCNITCRMCGPKFSSKWAEIKKVEVPKQDFNSVIDAIDFTHIKRIKYLGGEPFITPEFKQLIDRIPNKENVDLQVNTNATFFPSKYINELNKFKNMYVALSIDGIGKVDEYIRQGTEWKTKLEVIKQWIASDCTPYIHTVVQAHNIHDIKNIKMFAEEHNLKWSPAVINFPREFKLEALDEEYVNKIKDDDNSVFLNRINGHNKELNEKLKLVTEQMDELFGTKWENNENIL